MDIQNIVQLERKSLKRTLGVWDLFAIGYGDLGSSIYYALGITACFSLGATPISLAIAGLVFILTALTCAEMSAMFPESGGTATFTRHAFNDSLSFLAGWGLLLDYIVTIAISAFAIGPYLKPFFNVFNASSPYHVEWHIGFTIAIIIFLYFLNFFGTKHSTILSFILSAFTIITQLFVIVIAGIMVFKLPDFIHHLRINGPDLHWSPTWPQFIQGTVMAMVAYTGIESIIQLGSEAKEPGKTIPRAIKFVTIALLISYFSISAVALATVSPKELGTTYMEDPIAGIVANLPIDTKFLVPWVGLLAAMLLLVASNAGLIGSSRLSFFMSEHYQLPRALFILHPRFRTPHVTLGFFAILACLLVLASGGKMMFFANVYAFGAMIAFCAAHVALIVLRITKPDFPRPFKVPFNLKIKGYDIPISAVLGALATCAVWIANMMLKPEGRVICLGWLVAGTVLYVFYRRKKKIAAFAYVQIENIQVPEYGPLAIKNILVPTRGGVYTENVQIACEFAKQHRASITAIYVIEIPQSLPIDGLFPEKVAVAEAVLKRSEAIAREFDVPITMRIVKARNIGNAILDAINKERYDLIVIGARANNISSTVTRILKEAATRVWICKN